MSLIRLLLTLSTAGTIAFSASDLLAQETPSGPKDKPKAEGEEKPGLEQDLEKLKELSGRLLEGAGKLEESSKKLLEGVKKRGQVVDKLQDSFDRMLEALSKYRVFIDNERYNLYDRMRTRYVEARKKGSIRKINPYENSHWVEILWPINDDIEFSYLQDVFWFGGMIKKKNNGEYFSGYRLYMRKEGEKEVPFLEVVVDYDFDKDSEHGKPVIKLFDITQDEYEKLMKEIKEALEDEQWYFKEKVFRTYKAFMTDYFKNSEHSHYKGTFGDIIAGLKKKINDDDIDVRKQLLAAIPAYKGYVEADKVPIQRPKKKVEKPEEEKK